MPETLRLVSGFLFDFVGGVLRALRVAGADDDGFSGARPAQCKAHACRSGAAQDCDRDAG